MTGVPASTARGTALSLAGKLGMAKKKKKKNLEKFKHTEMYENIMSHHMLPHRFVKSPFIIYLGNILQINPKNPIH